MRRLIKIFVVVADSEALNKRLASIEDFFFCDSVYRFLFLLEHAVGVNIRRRKEEDTDVACLHSP